jgi:BirA family biotin operon repressor/biotin-[acetyl-CoA-carboxylase] ligase
MITIVLDAGRIRTMIRWNRVGRAVVDPSNGQALQSPREGREPMSEDKPAAVPDWLADLDRPLRYFDQIGSTNSEAAAWALAGAPEGALVLADEQIAGRGRHGRAWQAAPGSALLLSIVLRPALAPSDLGRIALLGAVALAEALGGLGLAPRIKWPNDVQLDRRKVAGILAEGVWHGETLAAVVLGMGINVTRGALSDAEAEAFHATTIEAVLGRTPDRGDLLHGLLARLDAWIPRAADPALLAAWRARNVTLGRQVRVQQGDQVLDGLAEDIDPQGALLLRTADGTQHRLLAGDVTLHNTESG